MGKPCVCAPAWLSAAPTPPETLLRAQSGGRGTALALSLEVLPRLDFDSQPQTLQVTELGPWDGLRLVVRTRAWGSLRGWQEQTLGAKLLVIWWARRPSMVVWTAEGGAWWGSPATLEGLPPSWRSVPELIFVLAWALLHVAVSPSGWHLLPGQALWSRVRSRCPQAVLSGRGWGLLRTWSPGLAPSPRGCSSVLRLHWGRGPPPGTAPGEGRPNTVRSGEPPRPPSTPKAWLAVLSPPALCSPDLAAP